MKKKKAAQASIVGAILLAIAGGSYAISLDFSSTTTTTIGGDTNIDISQEGEDYCRLAHLACEDDIIPERYEDICPIIELVCG